MSRRFNDRLARYVVFVSATISFLVLLAIAIFIIRDGLPAFKEIGITEFLFGTVWRPGL